MTDSVGKGIDRVDARAKVTGSAPYSAEIPVANVAHAIIVGASISRGRVTGIDARAAEKLPGVLAVITPANAPKLPGATKRSNPQARVVQLLQDDKVQYDGQPIAVVVAETLEQAEHAASLVKPTYAKETPELEIQAVLPYAFTPKPSGARAPADSSRGDFDGAFSSAPARIDATYTTPFETHNPMEMHATTAVWQGADRLTLYDSTQWVFGVQKRASEVFGIPKENVRVISRFVGGAFGSKGSPWSHVFLAAMAARVAGRPVRLMVTRGQMFQFVGYRPETRQHVRLGAKKDGTLVAIGHDVVSQTSRFDDFMEPSAYMTRMLYSCPNVRTSHRLVRLDVSTPTFMRGPGESTGSFALESAMDELAYELGMDPLELRLKNYAETDEDDHKPYSSKSLRECYRQAAERFGWSRRPRSPRTLRDGGWLVGYGMASSTYPARQQPSSALARIKRDGTAVVLAGTLDIGTGTYTIMTQIAADALGLPVDKVRFDLGDTEFPETPIEAGSITASSVGSAVKRAAEAARDKLKALAVADARSPLHGMALDQVDATDGRLVARGDPSRSDAFGALLERHGLPEIEEKIDEKESPARKGRSCHSFGAVFAEVGVDEDLGVVRVRRVVSAIGGGRILNAKTARSQLLGGVVWGIGMALEEKTVRDPRSARLVTKGLDDYHVPVNADVPPIDILMIPEEDPYVNAVGAKGLGEIGIVGVAAAIANAVYHATGKRVRDLPITVEALL